MAKIVLVSLVYNKRRFFGDCIMSAVNQTLSKNKWVHLLIDNNSTDGVTKTAEMFAKKYPHIRLEKMNKNLGQMPAYNWVLDRWLPNNMPDAEIMAQFDPDDMLTPIALEEISKKFDSNPEIGHTYSDFNIVNASGGLKIQAHPKAKQVDPKIEITEQGQKLLRAWELRFNVVGHLRAMRISSVRAVGGFDETYKYATDVNMACKMLSSQYKVCKIPKTLYQWREHGKDQVQGHAAEEQTACWRNIVHYYTAKWKKEGLM